MNTKYTLDNLTSERIDKYMCRDKDSITSRVNKIKGTIYFTFTCEYPDGSYCGWGLVEVNKMSYDSYRISIDGIDSDLNKEELIDYLTDLIT